MDATERLPEPDPLEKRSYALPFLLAVLTLVGVCLWAAWDEAEGRRPWKRWQRQFRRVGAAALREAIAAAKATGNRRGAEAARRLLARVEHWRVRIRQRTVPELGLVDRCETCHTAATWPGLEKLPLPWRSHPGLRGPAGLLVRHPVARFGCTSCHWGQGWALRKAAAHGQEPYWDWPLLPREHAEAGCQPCHEDSLVLEGAPRLTHGRRLFRRLGCWGCHVRKGFRRGRRRREELAAELRALEREAKRLAAAAQAAEEAGDWERLDALTVRRSQLDLALEEAARKLARWEQVLWDPGPSLAEIRVKVAPAWLVAWIREPRAFKPRTRMPTFRLSRAEAVDIAAYLWQHSQREPYPPAPPGDPVRGGELLRLRGCLGCHSLVAGGRRLGGDFATDLTRVGEKLNRRTGFAWMVAWIRSPQSMHVPARTVMPSLRLSPGEARDIAAFLVSLGPRAPAAAVPALEDPARAERGGRLIRRLGCHGCHQIPGLPAGETVGPDLTAVGAKPLGQFYFGALWEKAHSSRPEDQLWFWRPGEPAGWYDRRSYFLLKLKDPAAFNQGSKPHHAPMELLMPTYGLADRDLFDLTTFLLGSLGPYHSDQRPPRFPPRRPYRPRGAARALAEGWWVVDRFNCTGCHALQAGDSPAIQTLPAFQGEGRADAPPSLVGVARRLKEGFLSRFLKDPSLGKRAVANGVRPYLPTRMPSFAFAPGDVATLVRFFAALAGIEAPVPETPPPSLTERDRLLARELFQALDCMRCHPWSEEPWTWTPETKAPSYRLTATRLRPAWLRLWLTAPSALMPGTKMPDGYFRREGRRWVAAQVPVSLRDYPGDHLELMVRYLYAFDAAEEAYHGERLLAAEAERLPARISALREEIQSLEAEAADPEELAQLRRQLAQWQERLAHIRRYFAARKGASRG